MSFHIKSPAEQVAAHLEAEILRGQWRELIPGVIRLSSELGVNRTTLLAGMRLLEMRGLLETGGEKKRRRIVMPKHSTPAGLRSTLPESGSARRLRVRILLFNKGDETSRDMLHLVQHLHMHMTRHDPEFASRSLWSLGMDARRVARFVESNPADAWVVLAASREILEWFADQPFPCFALLGGFRGVNLAGAKPDKVAAQRKALHRLAELGQVRRGRDDRSGGEMSQRSGVNGTNLTDIWDISKRPFKASRASWAGTRFRRVRRMMGE